MGLVHSFRLGDLNCHALEAGVIRLDGGGMFGIVPKPVWSKRLQPDDRNRVRLAMRCLLVEHPDGLTLIDTGLGNKEDQRFLDLYGIENVGRDGRSQLEDALAATGHEPNDVRWVINTHLHFDHAGGNTWEERDETGVALGGAQIAFPNATYVVQRDELEFARDTNERTKAAYLEQNFEPIAEAGRWRLLRGEVDVLPGISVRLTPGHVPHHQSVLIESGSESLLFLGDVMPTSHHLPLPWIMGHDLEPLRTLESKRRLLKVAADEGRWLFFQHDPEVIMGRVGEGSRGLALGDVVRVGGSGFEGV